MSIPLSTIDDLARRVRHSPALADDLKARMDACRHAREAALLEQRAAEARRALAAVAGPTVRVAEDGSWLRAEESAVLLADACWWVEQLLAGEPRVA